MSSINSYSQHSTLKDLPSNRIKPHGWVKEFLKRQESGLTGNPEESGFPFNTGMWTENMNYKDREFNGGSGWWPYEQTGYYLDGALRCAYMNQSQKLKQKVLNNIDYVLANIDKDGVLHAGKIDDDWWPLVVFMRMLFEQYENTQDSELLKALENHYQATYKKEESYNIPKSGGFEVRSVLHLEHLMSLYQVTGNEWYLQVAKRLYHKFETNLLESPNGAGMLTATGMAKGLKPSGHAVTYHEFLKIPAILYYYTKDEKYKEALYKAYKLLENHHELADGLSSGIEELHGNNTDMAHEVCNVTDYNWTSGWALLATGDAYFADKMEKVIYNAGFSSITSDFKAHQYYSTPNMPISSDVSSFYNDNTNWGFTGKGRLCYRPGHDTECCTGNIHRMFPTFLNRSCLVGKKEAKIVFYLPGTFTIPFGKEFLSITQDTNYPFSHSVSLNINTAPKKNITLGLRVPGWCDNYTIILNGKEIKNGHRNSFFETVSRKFKKGDQIEITFSTKPKIEKRHGIAINYGPLVFSYPIEAKKRITTNDEGQKCSPEFPAYQLFPKEHLNWAYAIPSDITSNDIKVIKGNQVGYPWGIRNSPIKLQVKARAVSNWSLKYHTSISEIPDKVLLKDEPEQILTLEPIGTTLLRITEFPVY
ncbi:beta-L-arabinofuranosidase domain-containing protein [Flavivirga algicola]|uniref:Glycosyl hydrolase n=1 Tax=Flavivirga algicola TaxID=2729136 RepID=A0ABX1S3F3_9FLAO|nr:beta-L-arabinofuranosidase domain-containing protein [Flavivirga algicola]NMH89433.1 hypothetical protein [Flavivirga algicola]